MKEVVLLYSKNLTDSTGASSVMRTFNENISLFNQNNIDLSIYSRDAYIKQAEGQSSCVPKSRMKLFLVNFLKKAAKRNSLAAFAKIYIESIRPAKRIVKYYLKQSKGSSKIIFTHEIFTCYEYLKIADKKDKIIFVIHTCGDIYNSYKLDYDIFSKSLFFKHLIRIENEVLNAVDKIGFVARSPSEYFVETHKENLLDKLFYVYNGLPVLKADVELRLDSEEANSVIEICCVATVNERKGQRFIVEALKIMASLKKLPKIHFTIIGDGIIKDELEQLSEDYAINEYISFYGRSNNVTAHLLQSDILILPSMDEGFPIAILEAMRVSLPIVSTKVGGIPEMIEEGVTGIFIEPSIEGVCGFISQINNYNWKMMGKESYRLFLEKFTVKSMIDSYCTIMKQL